MRYKNLRMFITFEGIEGVGKTTQIKLIEKFFKKEGISYILTREPGGLPISEKIRSILLHEDMDPLTELFLYEAARAEHFVKIIKNEKKIILCDRFTDATIAYQGYGRGINIELIEKLNHIATYGKKPDLTLLIDINVDLAFERVKSRNNDLDRFESLDKEFFKKVRFGYLDIAKKEPNRVKIIDGSGSIKNTHNQILREIVCARKNYK